MTYNEFRVKIQIISGLLLAHSIFSLAPFIELIRESYPLNGSLKPYRKGLFSSSSFTCDPDWLRTLISCKSSLLVIIKLVAFLPAKKGLRGLLFKILIFGLKFGSCSSMMMLNWLQTFHNRYLNFCQGWHALNNQLLPFERGYGNEFVALHVVKMY